MVRLVLARKGPPPIQDAQLSAAQGDTTEGVPLRLARSPVGWEHTCARAAHARARGRRSHTACARVAAADLFGGDGGAVFLEEGVAVQEAAAADDAQGAADRVAVGVGGGQMFCGAFTLEHAAGGGGAVVRSARPRGCTKTAASGTGTDMTCADPGQVLSAAMCRSQTPLSLRKKAPKEVLPLSSASKPMTAMSSCSGLEPPSRYSPDRGPGLGKHFCCALCAGQTVESTYGWLIGTVMECPPDCASGS